jgi:hypothetical protein
MQNCKDFPIISRYTLGQAIMDGVLVRIATYQGKAVVATSHILEHISKDDLLEVFHEFCEWDMYTRPELAEEDQLFHMEWNGRKVWVIESGESYTLMFPEDY